MEKLQGRGVIPGRASGQALVSKMPLNITGAFSSIINVLPGKGGVIMDRNHDLYHQNIQGKILVFPAAIGSTFTGMVLMRLIDIGAGPAALIVQNADSLLVSGVVLARVWFDKSIPVIEYPHPDLFDKINCGDRIDIDGDSGEIQIV
jgi:predicted aconitase with swiveling domain